MSVLLPHDLRIASCGCFRFIAICNGLWREKGGGRHKNHRKLGRVGTRNYDSVQDVCRMRLSLLRCWQNSTRSKFVLILQEIALNLLANVCAVPSCQMMVANDEILIACVMNELVSVIKQMCFRFSFMGIWAHSEFYSLYSGQCFSLSFLLINLHLTAYKYSSLWSSHLHKFASSL